jgi:mono/diheme cytochrome c family protein
MRIPSASASIAASALAAAVFLLVACSDSTSSSDAPGAPAPTFTGLDGASLYGQACASCHGVELTGTDSGPPFLNAIYRPGHHGDASFLLAVRRGARAHHWNFGDMPPIEGLSDEQVAAILEFVRMRQVDAGIE